MTWLESSLAGVSRSITILVAYMMSVTSLNWKDALDCVRSVRSIANPNLGFRKQLQEFEGRRLREVSNSRNELSVRLERERERGINFDTGLE